MLRVAPGVAVQVRYSEVVSLSKTAAKITFWTAVNISKVKEFTFLYKFL